MSRAFRKRWAAAAILVCRDIRRVLRDEGRQNSLRYDKVRIVWPSRCHWVAIWWKREHVHLTDPRRQCGRSIPVTREVEAICDGIPHGASQ